MQKLYSWLANQPPATRSVDFVTTRMILALIALLYSFYYHYLLLFNVLLLLLFNLLLYLMDTNNWQQFYQ